MAKHPPVTFQGALSLFGQYDRPWLDKIDKIAGGLILAAGLAPDATAVSAVWGWVDQKTQATSLLRSMVDSVADKLLDTGGLERHQLVIAAHTTLAVSAVFDALAESSFANIIDEAAVSDRHKLMLMGAAQDEVDTVVRALYRLEVPGPSVAKGFEENVTEIRAWAAQLALRILEFAIKVAGDHISEQTNSSAVQMADVRQLGAAAAERYRSYYLQFAARVPEFEVWAGRVEHAATRTSLGRLEQLLTHLGEQIQVRDLRAVVRDVNGGVVRRPVIDSALDGYGVDVAFPAVEDLYVEPRCRVTTAYSDSRIADENWWNDLTICDDIPLLLARHFTSAESFVRPLLLLGHPGAGKSLLTKVIAARLPDQQYTAVWVPLRHVEASAGVAEQIQQALDLATNQRVRWPDLVDQSVDVTRVVLLDGLDELLQASTTDRGDYLHRIADFQRREADMGHPVCVIVTSRTLVADRVAMPSGTPVIKLEEFDEPQIREWVRRWNEFRSGSPLPDMSAQWALDHRELAAQPLLLLMLTLYHATRDTDVPEQLSTTNLYERLFDDFTKREVTKKSAGALRGPDLANAVEVQLRTLAVAALGMFNRGRQDITEEELGEDLRALEGKSSSSQRLLGEFFFMHTPEAKAPVPRRSYEFLHATFGEYLVASRVIDELREVTRLAHARRVPDDAVDDDRLFALLSHQPLAVRQPTLTFAGAMLAMLESSENRKIRDTLDLLLNGYRNRTPFRRYGDYRPTGRDALRSMATYTANLFLLRIRRAVAGTGARLVHVFTEGPPLDRWRATVELWKAGLDESSYHSMLGAIDLVDGDTVARHGLQGHVAQLQELHHARLMHSLDTLSRLRQGDAIQNGTSYIVLRGSDASRAREWVDYVQSWLRVACMTGATVPHLARAPIPAQVSDADRSTLTVLIQRVLSAPDDQSTVFREDRIKQEAGWIAEQLGGPIAQAAANMLDKIESNRDLLASIKALAALEGTNPEFINHKAAFDATFFDIASRKLAMGLQQDISDILNVWTPDEEMHVENLSSEWALAKLTNYWKNRVTVNTAVHCVSIKDAPEGTIIEPLDYSSMILSSAFHKVIKFAAARDDT